MDTKNRFDERLKTMFRSLPAEEIHPSVKVDLLNRIAHYKEGIKRQNLFARLLYRTSQIALALSVVVFIAFLPTLVRFYGPVSPASQPVAMEKTLSTNEGTNRRPQYFESIQPDYSMVSTVGYGY